MMMLAVALAAVQGMAQSEKGSWTVTPKVGMNWATRAGDDIYYGPDMNQKVGHSAKRGLAVGVEAEYQLTGGVGLSGGVVYSQQGMLYDDIDQYWHDQKLQMDYLNIPLMVHAYVAPNLAFAVGVQPGFLVHKKLSGEEYFSEGNRSGYQSFETSDLYYRSFDFGIPVGVSYDLGYLRLEFRYSFGLYDTTKVGMHEHNNVAQLTVGYRFGL